MAKKRQVSQIDDPPTPAPKDDPPPSPETPVEDKVKDDEEEDDDSTSSGEDSSSEGEEDEEEEDEEEENQKTPSTQPAPKNTPPPSSNSKPKSPPSSEGESESESESDSEPISKSMPLPSKPSKSQPQSSAAAARSGAKRPIDSDTKPLPSKKQKTIAADEAKEPEEAKKLFQRVFNGEDELAILKGAVEFIAKTGNDPYKYVTAFFETVKKAIHVEITLEQLRDKMRRLKLKFENKMKSMKNKKKPNFSKPIDEQMFELSQKIWGDKVQFNEAEEKVKPNGKGVKKESAVKKPPTFKKEPDSPLVVLKETRKVESSVEKDVPGANLILNEMVGSNGPNLVAMKRGFELLEESKKEEMEARWKKLQIAELEVFVERAELVEDTARCILDALKSSSS